MTDVAGALRAVVDALERLNVDYVLVGSVAAAAWGVVRSTRDADLVAFMDSNHLRAMLAGLDRREFYVPEDFADSAVRSGGSFNVLHLTGGGKVDIFVPVSGDSFAQSRLSRRVRAEVLGVRAWMATPEDVLLAKLRWRLESRSEMQWRDCIEIAASNQLDLQYLNRWAPTLGVEVDLAELLRSVETSD